MIKPKQGESILTNFDPVKGHEQSGYRPALVVSNADFGKASNLIWICPITNTNRKKPMESHNSQSNCSGFEFSDYAITVLKN